MARNKQFKGISVLLRTIYDRVWGQRYLAIPFPPIIELCARLAAISLYNVTGRGDCECNYIVNYLKKIEMPWRLPKNQLNEDKCAINQQIYMLTKARSKMKLKRTNESSYI